MFAPTSSLSFTNENGVHAGDGWSVGGSSGHCLANTINCSWTTTIAHGMTGQLPATASGPTHEA